MFYFLHYSTIHCIGYLSCTITDSAQCLSYMKFTVFREGQLVPEVVSIGNLESTSFVLSGPVGAFYGFSDSTCISGLGTYTLLPGSEVKGQWPFIACFKCISIQHLLWNSVWCGQLPSIASQYSLFMTSYIVTNSFLSSPLPLCLPPLWRSLCVPRHLP